MVIEDEKLTFWRLRVPASQFNKEWKGGMGAPECWKCEIPIKGERLMHKGITRDWVNAILKELRSFHRGVEGIKGLQLANAMLFICMDDNGLTYR